jgi:hypothetical protein
MAEAAPSSPDCVECASVATIIRPVSAQSRGQTLEFTLSCFYRVPTNAERRLPRNDDPAAIFSTMCKKQYIMCKTLLSMICNFEPGERTTSVL